MTERWRSRLRTAEAMVALCAARLMIATIPFRRWRHGIGGTAAARASRQLSKDAVRLAAHVEWAAKRLPFETKCLPRAMALSWILRSRTIEHCLVFAVRPAELRGTDDQLHAWVEVAGDIILGKMPGPWVVTLRLGDSR